MLLMSSAGRLGDSAQVEYSRPDPTEIEPSPLSIDDSFRIAAG